MLTLLKAIWTKIVSYKNRRERTYYHNLFRMHNMQFDGTDIDQEITDEWIKDHPNYLKLE